MDVKTAATTPPQRVTIERAVNHRGEIAVRTIGDQLHGYWLTDMTGIEPGFVRVMLHWEVCPEEPKPEQHPLFEIEEGTTPHE